MLFLPVSGAFGRGEYARSLSIAQAAKLKWPEALIHFALSRQAPYAASSPFPATLLESSPTFHTAAVSELIAKFRPHIVIFDNAGRTAQLRAASAVGARIVYISARSRQRRKAFRFTWMRLIDEHWIAYPEFIAGALSRFEQFKLNWLQRPTVRYLDVILARTAPTQESIMRRSDLKPASFVLIVPGGGTNHPRAAAANETFLAAANTLSERGHLAVFVGPATLANSQLRRFESLPQSELAELMSNARLIVTNGGSTLLQAIACGGACIAAPIAKDQPDRIQRCVEAAVAIASALDASSLVHAAEQLLIDEAARQGLARRAANLKLADGIDIALAALIPMIEAG
jgi:hypothetical protein